MTNASQLLCMSIDIFRRMCTYCTKVRFFDISQQPILKQHEANTDHDIIDVHSIRKQIGKHPFTHSITDFIQFPRQNILFNYRLAAENLRSFSENYG